MFPVVLAIANAFFKTTQATPSIMQCPMNMNMVGVGQTFPYAGGFNTGGEFCGSGSFLHFYTCCDDNPFACCFEFETWAIVVFSVAVVLIIGSILLAVARYACSQY